MSTVELNVFDVSRILRSEYKAYRALITLGLSAESASRVLLTGNQQLHTEAKLQPGVLKTGPESGRVYLNDLEEDKKYSEWSSDIEDMFMGGPNSVVGINVFNLLLVGDVKTEGFWRVMKSLTLMYQSNWPLHIGVILTNPNNLNLNALLLSMIRALRKEDETLPMLFLSDLDADLTEESLHEAFAGICYEHCKVNMEQELLTAKRAVEFCRVTGVCDAQILLNGRLLDKAAEGRLDRVIYTETNQERQLLGFLLYNRALKSPVERFFEEGKHSKVIERLNSCITVSDLAELEVSQVEIAEEGFMLQTDPSQVKKMTITLGISLENVELLKLAVKFLREKSEAPARFRVLFRRPKSGDISYIIFLAHLMSVGDLERLETALESQHLAMENPDNSLSASNLLSQQRIFDEVSADSFVLVRGRLIDARCFRDYRDFELLLKTELVRVSIDEESLEFVTDIDNASAERVSNVLDKAGEALIRAVKRLPAIHKYREFPIPNLPTKYTSIDLTSDSPIQVITLLNPLRPESQRLLSILSWLQDFGVSVRLILNPQLIYSEGEQPLQRWYGYVAGSKLGEELKMKLTEAVMVTLSLDTPEKWVVYSKQTDLDLDNLRSADDVEVVYELSGLVVDGSCAQLLYGYPTEPPAGLQLVLSNATHPFVADTSVMQNVGYYQFQANPGVYKIRLKEGRSKELFELFGEERIVLDGLTPELQNMGVTKKEGMEEKELLGEEAEWVAIGDTIHVFTLASGHLYERLLRIMILSVLSHTSSKVKFWILGNFLSPKFRASMPALALKLDFEYEFVTYAWPFWLYPQKEKQRLIWAYKILFLDVLFPLSIPKIIYIDADQVVRSDIKELWEMDLQGAPYAYTPFCDSNKDTEGFRFWKSGFWKKHLSGLPYHISALYVVDLNKFRSMSAGDTLRYLYMNMARDPNSLANLDQDLPNYAQQQVPIFSLPQEWLWCATWCSIEDLKTAKTIDLCNNPLTKEPKIQAAKRLITEWSQYDQLLQDFDKSQLTNTTFDFHREPTPPRDDL